MLINDKEYKFYEILDVEYVLLAATSEEQAIADYIDYVQTHYDASFVQVNEIEEVPYTYAKRKFELNPQIVNYGYLISKNFTFDDVVAVAIEEDDGFLLIEHDVWDSLEQ